MPISTGRLWASGAIRKCSSIARKPASSSRKSSGPIAIISDSPIAESIEYRPPTQSQNPNMFVGVDAELAHLVGVGGHGDEVRRDRGLVVQPRQQPVAGGPRVGQRLERRERLAADDEQRLGGIEVHRGLADVRRRRRCDTNRNVRARSEYWRRASVAIAGPRSEPPMPMLITFRIGLPGEPGPLVVADPHRERGHPVEDRMDLARRRPGRRRSGARSRAPAGPCAGRPDPRSC